MSRKRSVSIRGHRTSYSLEPEFQREIEELARVEGIALARLVARVDLRRDPETSLSAALRLHVLAELKARLQDETEGSPAEE